MHRQLIESYPNYDLFGVYDGDKLLYRTTEDKPLPSEEYNERIIAQQKPKVKPFTEEEKASYRARSFEKSAKADLSNYAIKKIRKFYDQKIKVTDIAAMYDLSTNAVYNIVKRKTYAHVK